MSSPKQLQAELSSLSVQKPTQGLLPGLSFLQASEACLEHRERNGIRRVPETRAWLKQYIYPALGALPLGEIQPQQLLGVLLQLKTQGLEGMLKPCHAYCCQLFAYALRRGWAHFNPARELKGLPAFSRLFAFSLPQTPSSLGELLRNMESIRHTVLGAALCISPYVFLRTSELSGAAWAEFDFENALWLIPASRLPSQPLEPLLVPLAPQVKTYFQKLHALTGNGPYVFPGYNKTRPAPIKPGSLRMALHRLGYGCGSLVNYTLHGFRRLASDFLLQHGFHPAWIDMQLAQRSRQQRKNTPPLLLPQRREMLQTWADYLDGLKAEASFQTQFNEEGIVEPVEP